MEEINYLVIGSTYWSLVLELVAQFCLALCDPMGGNLLCSSVHGILQARILEWVAVPFSRGSSQPRDQSEPPGKPYWSLRIDNFNPSDTTLLLHHQPFRELCTRSHTLRLPSLTWSLKMSCWNPLGSSGFLSISQLKSISSVSQTPCTVPCNKCCAFLHQNLVSVAWLYCIQGIRAKLVP